MLGLAIVLAAAWLGAGAVRRLGWPLGRFEAVALAAAFALTAAPWVLFVAAWGLGFATGLPAGVVALALAGHLLGRARRVPPGDPGPAPSRLAWGAFGVLFALLFHSHMLHQEAAGIFTGGSTFSDLALHATLASRFAVDEIDLASPIASGQPLTYPFLGDFLVGCLVRGGWSMSTAFAVTGWISAMTGLALIDAVARRLWKRRAAGVIAVSLVVLSGALIGTWYAITDVAARGLPAEAAHLPSYANQWPRGVTWSNFVCDFLLPQRALLAAFPAVWAAGFLLRGACDDAPPPALRRRALLGAGVLIGALPMLHVHSFLVCAGLLAFTALVRTAADRRVHADWWLALAVALAMAAPQLWWQLGQSWHGGFGRWNVGWRAPEGEWWTYWLRNWGLPFALLPVALVLAVRARRSGFAAVLAVAGIALFAAGNLYQFQPHDWDNMKFFVYAHMAIAVVLAGGLARWLAGGWWRRTTAAVALVAMTSTGALTLVRELDLHDQLASANDVKLAKAVRRHVPADAVVLTSDQHSHVVSMLAGRKVVMGYRGWLWTHGIDDRRLHDHVRRMFDGGDDALALLRHHHVTHVYIGPGELRDWGADPVWYRNRFPSVMNQDGAEVFDVRGRPTLLAVGATRSSP